MESASVKPKRKILQAAIASIIIVGVALWVTGAIATELTDNKSFLYDPSYTRPTARVEKVEYDLLHPLDWIKNLNPDVPLTFDNNADITIVKAGVNAVPITESDMNSVDNVISPSNRQGYFGIDLVFPALLQTGDQVKVERKPLVFNSVQFPEAVTLNSRYDLTIERAGTQLTSGIIDKDAKTIEIFKDPYVIKAGVPYFHGITIRVTRNDGTIYEIGYSSPEDIRELKALPILDDAPILEWEEVQVENYTIARIKNADQPGKLVDATTPLLETTAKNTIVQYIISGNNFTTRQETLIFDNSIFLTDANGKLEYLPQP